MNQILEKLKEHDTCFLEHDKRFDAHDKRFDEHDRRFDEHDRRFDEHDKRFDDIDRRFDCVDKKFDEIDKRFDHIDGQIDFLATKFLEHEDRLQRIEENMATKSDLRGISDTLDKLVALMLKRDQEVTFLTHSVKQLWNKFEEHDKDIKRMKPLLSLV